jgi:phospholipid-transporting ATPase
MILNICEFNSTRKRMSAIVRTPNGQIKIMIKGADTVILERLAKEGNPFVDITCTHLEEYASVGLRTLVIASRDISEDEYARWSVEYDKAATTINNRADALDAVAEKIEVDLILMGATAIEDKLQDGVPETIATLALAGIKIWVLTGDRQETAINIGYASKLITEEMSLIVCNEDTREATRAFLLDKLELVRMGVYGESTRDATDSHANLIEDNDEAERVPLLTGLWRRVLNGKKKRRFDKDTVVDAEPLALVIDGKTLGFALEDDTRLILLELAIYCKAVLCCRVSPLQKALVVKLVKKNVDESVTLAIGGLWLFLMVKMVLMMSR